MTNRALPFILLLVLLAVSPVGVSSADFPIREGHPRIYVTPENIPELQRRCQEEYKTLYQDLRGTSWILDREPGVEYSDMHNMAMPAFLYIIEGEERYAANVKKYLDALAKNPPHDQYLTPEYVRQASMVYDWIYDTLTQDEKQRYAGALVDMGDYLTTLWRHSDFNNHFVNECVAVIYIGVALYKDGVADEKAEAFLAQGADYLKQHVIPAGDEIAGLDGGQAEGFSYNDWGYARPSALTTEMWRVATGEDLFAGSSFFRTQAVWHLYGQRPHDGAYVKAEDCPSGLLPGENLKTFMPILAARTGDGYAQWIADQIPWRYKQQSWKEILWRDPNVPAVGPDDLPLARHFRKLGWVVSRSGWNDANDTYALFQCGDFYAGHQHFDANHFVIHKGASLAIDSGVNEYSAHRANYYARTIAHNSLLVFDPQETFSSAVWVGEDTNGSNDGGQMKRDIISRTGVFEEHGERDIATITQFHSTPNFTYVCGDATKAYHPRKMEAFTRQFVHIQPDVFVVFDRVVSKDPSFKKTWLLHSIPEPEKDGAVVTIRHQDSVLVSETLLPTNPVIESIGGPGKEFWVNGQNYPPDRKRDPESGSWRIEVSPSESKTHDLFLHVLTAGADTHAAPAKAELLRDGDRTGVTVQVGPQTTTLLFATEGEPLMRIRIEKDGVLVEEKLVDGPRTHVPSHELH